MQLVERLFSDPSLFPAVFKNWITNQLEENPPRTFWDNIVGAPSNLGGGPIGSIYLWPKSTPPALHLGLDGAVVSRTTYKTIFDIFGTTFGVGDGSTTFGLPDTRGRVIAGLGTHNDVNAIGDSDGMGTVGDRRTKHAHSGNTGTGSGSTGSAGGHDHGGATGSDGGHSHSYTQPDATSVALGGPDQSVVPSSSGGTTGSVGGHSHTISSEGDHSHSIGSHTHTMPTLANSPTDGPAWLTLLYIIRYA